MKTAAARVVRASAPQARAKAALAPPLAERRTGELLDREARTLMEARFGHDFGRVRVHHDGRAAQRAAAYTAAAYTLGADIHFAAGRYRPHTSAGRALLAHELAHVVQQRAAEQSGSTATASLRPADSAAERSADDASMRVLHGLAVPSLAATPLGIARLSARKTAGSSGKLRADANWSEEPGEKAKREAREKENAELAKEGKPPLPRIDVRETYLADVKQRMQQKMAATEAMEVGEELHACDLRRRAEGNHQEAARLGAGKDGAARGTRMWRRISGG